MAAMGWARMLKGMGGIRKEAATWHTSSFIRRRNSTTFTAVAEEVEKDKKDEDKSLYLCFNEFRGRPNCWTYSLQSIGLSHLLQGRSTSTDISGNGDHKSRLQLHESAFRGGSDADVPEFLISVSPNLGSKFIFTSSSAHDGGIAKWVPKRLKPNPYLLEVDGKIFRFRFRTTELLYSLVPFNPCESFEVFDPNDSQWLPLDLPPCDVDKDKLFLLDRYSFNHAVAGSNILRWAGWFTGVSRFDVTHPEQGWTQLNSSVGSCLWGLETAQVFFLDLHQQDRDHDHDGYVMFSSDDFDSTIQVFLMSQECDSLKPMQPLQLPQLLPGCPCDLEDSSFVHLGGRKVGLVLKSSKLAYPGIPLYDKVHIFLITFEYELITTEDALDVKTRLLTTRCLEYEPDERWEEKWRTAQHANLIGAYVL